MYNELEIQRYLNQALKKRGVTPKKAMVEKKSEIQGGGQEMAVMVG